MIHGFGKLCLDYLMRVDHYPEKNSLVHIQENSYSLGGMVANALRTADHFSSRTMLYSYLGTDPYGRILKDELQKTGIGIERLVSTEKTDFSNIIIHNEDRAIMSCRAIRQSKNARDFPFDFGKDDILLIDCTTMAGTADLLKQAKACGVITVMDVSTANHDSSLEDFFPFVDYLIPSYDWARSYSHEREPEKIGEYFSRKGTGYMVMTNGENPVYLSHRGSTRSFRPIKAKVKNSNGAGDVFHGAFCHGLSRGWEREKIIRFSMAAGTARCRIDRIEDIPCEKEIVSEAKTIKACHV